MRRKMALLGLAPAAVAVALGASACGGSSNSSAGNSNTTSPATASTAPAGASATQTYTMEVLNGKLATKYGILSTADGIGHDTFMPSHLTLKAGVPVKMTVYNYDEGPHTFTVGNLNINEQIKAHVSDRQPSVTTFTVTFPKAGTYRFYCALPCDAGQGGWAMTADRRGNGAAQDGFMAADHRSSAKVSAPTHDADDRRGLARFRERWLTENGSSEGAPIGLAQEHYERTGAMDC